MTRRKIGILLLGCFLGTGMVLQYLGWVRATRAFTANNLIRLHVIANSNDKKDQELKYMVRDRIVEVLRQQLIKAKSYGEAREIVKNNRSRLARIAREAVAVAGYPYPVQVEWGRFTFPTRAYGSLVLPEGEYEAVRVVLGEGKGANWWCVLFPPLCFVDISGDAMEIQEKPAARETLAQETGGLIQQQEEKQGENETDLRFRFLEWLRRDDWYLARIMGS